jgi:hypothetical protein
MLFRYIGYCCPGFLLLSLIFWAFAGYAYRVNAKRPADDPKKKNFHPGAIFLAPVTWPLFLIVSMSLFIIRALVYGVFLLLFTTALFAFQTSLVPIGLDNTFSWIGNKLLEANTFLIRIAFGDWERDTQTI